jgi:hypothetical protein
LQDTTDTVVPVSASDARCSTAEFSMRKQPDDCARPMDFTSLMQVKSHRAQRVFEAGRHLPRKAAVTFAHFGR